MKTLKFLLAGAVALMALAGCKSDELEPEYDDAYYASYASISSSDSDFTSNSTGGTIHFKVEGGEVKVFVSCGTEWSVQNNNPTNFNAYIEDSYYLTVSAGQNLVEEELTGTITLMTAEKHIAFASITVTQNAYGAPEITVSTNEWNAPAVGNLTTTITVDSTDEWNVEGDAEWLTIEKSETSLNLTAEENEDTEERTAEIILTCTDGYNSDSETITVTQDGLAYITVSEESLEFDLSGGEAVITVESNFEWEYIYESEWFSIEKNEEDGSLKITCEASEVEEDREGVVTFTAGDGASNTAKVEFAITQVVHTLKVETTEWHAPALGELTKEIEVEAPSDWSAEAKVDWLTVEKTETGIILTAKENTETTERSGEIVLSYTDESNSDSVSVTVTQDGLAYITLSDECLEFDLSGGEEFITVESNFEWEYVYESEWFSIEKNEEGGSLKITCDASEVEKNREGVVTFTAGDDALNVAKVELVVTQVVHTLKVETTEWHAPALGELTKEIGVEAPTDWSAESKVDWLTVEKTETGIILTAKENTETTERRGEVVLSRTPGIKTVSDTISVTQDGLAYISLSEEELLVSSFGSSISVTVESNFDWECTCDAVWLTATKNEAENSLTMEYITNGTGIERSTVVTITAGDGVQNTADTEIRITQSPDNFDALILEYTITNSNTIIRLPIQNLTNVTIDWGTGSTTVTSSDCPGHTYGSGTYTVTINGIVMSIDSNHYLVQGSRYLTAVKQWGDTGLTSMGYAFYNCSNLQSIPEVVNSNSFSRVTTFNSAFRSCTSLVSVPALGNCPVATTFENAFYGCTSLTTVPENIFSGCTAVRNFNSTFYNCSSIVSAPSFEGCSSVTTFASAFYGCTNLTAVPENMFSGCTAAASFNSTFYNCSSITSAPSFEGFSSATTFEDTFYGCTSMATIPQNMFSGCTAATSFNSTFYNCSVLVSTAPSFEGCSSATTFEDTFYGCTSLTAIPENMFSGCTASTTFCRTFYNCSFLVSAPSFEGCSNVTTFEDTFNGCTALTTVPEKIFSGCTAVTTFNSTFSGCSSLKSVPVSLFDDTLLVTNFGSTFNGCSSISGESPYTEVHVEGNKVNVHIYQRGNYPEYMGCSTPTSYSDCFSGSTFSDIDSTPSGWGGNGN